MSDKTKEWLEPDEIPEQNENLMWTLDAANEHYVNLPDGAWFSAMEDMAQFWWTDCTENHNDREFCPNTAVHNWIAWSKEDKLS